MKVIFRATIAVTLLLISATNAFLFSEEEPWAEDKYNTTEFISIPPGRSVRNSAGYQQYGSYSTVLNQQGQYDLELELVLEGPQKIDGFIYQQWFQLRDPIESLKTDDDEDSYYESLTCSIMYADDIFENGISMRNSVIQGYKGEEEIKDAVGEFDEIIPFDQSTTFPWFIDYSKSGVTINEETGDVKVRCVLFRDFITDWTEIPIAIDDTIDWLVGYRVYSTDGADSPQAKGYADGLQMTIKYLSANSLFAVSSLILVSTQLASLIF